MLQIIFGDDEHTAADGPYARLMKTRKWLYLGSLAEFAVSTGLYNEGAAADFLHVVRLPSSALEPALIFGLSYLLLQYVFLFIQLVTTYDITLAERFTFRRADELATVRDRLDVARQNYRDRLDAFSRNSEAVLAKRAAELEAELVVARQERLLATEQCETAELGRGSENLSELRWKMGRANAKHALAQDRFREISEKPEKALERIDPHDDEDVRSAAEARDEAEHALRSLQRQVHSNRPGYRILEILIDISRVVPPALIAAFALISAALS